MTRLHEHLSAHRFVVTSELNPPKGIDLGALLDKARMLNGCVDAFNVTHSAGAHMAMAPIAACRVLMEQGVEPILQLTSRDRNRIALQADMLAAAALGVENLLVMGGDPPRNGDHPEAKPVFDLYASQIIAAAKALSRGHDLAGHRLRGSPRLCVGAVVNPGAGNRDDELLRMREKVEAGARFMQTQAVYDCDNYLDFVTAAEGIRVPLLAGIIPLKSVRMARFLNEKVPGIHVPDELIAELASAADKRAKAIEIAARTIRRVKDRCQGIHIMAIGWEEVIPEILAAADVARAA